MAMIEYLVITPHQKVINMLRTSKSIIQMVLLVTILALDCSASPKGSGGLIEPPPLPSSPIDVEKWKQITEKAEADRLAACSKAGGVWESYGHQNKMVYCLTPKKKKLKEECLAQKGEWRPKYGIFASAEPLCIIKYPDARKHCRTNNECMSKFCMAGAVNEDHGYCSQTIALVCESVNEYEELVKARKTGGEFPAYCVE